MLVIVEPEQICLLLKMFFSVYLPLNTLINIVYVSEDDRCIYWLAVVAYFRLPTQRQVLPGRSSVPEWGRM